MNSPHSSVADRIQVDAAAGALHDGAVRYVLIRADSLMSAFAGVPGSVGLQALRESVYRHGRHSVLRYQADQPGDAEVMVATVQQMAARLGWGVWAIERSGGDECTLTVRNSPFAHAAGRSAQPVCAPTLGLFHALSEVLLGTKANAAERDCIACGGSACVFVARRSPDQ
jgi:uncharacterized protein